MGDLHITPITSVFLVLTLALVALVVWLLTRGIQYLAASRFGHDGPQSRRGPGVPDDGAWSLGAIQQRAAWVRRAGLAVGAGCWVAYSVMVSGDVTLLGPSLLAVGYVAGVLIGEALMPGPAAAVVRNSGLRARRPSDYVDGAAWWVLAAAAAGVLATAAVAASLSAADGRSRVFDCSAATADLDPSRLPAWIQQSWDSTGWLGARSGGSATLTAGRWHLHQIADWPGLVVLLPLLVVWAAGLTLAWITLRRVVARPRFSQEPAAVALDDRVRTQSARRIVAACGVLLLVPLGLVMRTMGASLLHACNPTQASFPGRYLLDTANVLVVLALVAAVGYPATARVARGSDGTKATDTSGNGKALMP